MLCTPLVDCVIELGTERPKPTQFDIAWNYEKFLVDGDGRPVGRYASDADPLTAEGDIKQLLGLQDDAPHRLHVE